MAPDIVVQQNIIVLLLILYDISIFLPTKFGEMLTALVAMDFVAMMINATIFLKRLLVLLKLHIRTNGAPAVAIFVAVILPLSITD